MKKSIIIIKLAGYEREMEHDSPVDFLGCQQQASFAAHKLSLAEQLAASAAGSSIAAAVPDLAEFVAGEHYQSH